MKKSNILVYNDIYEWKGWGGRLGLGSGKCWLRLFDLERDEAKKLTHLKSIIAIVSDVSKIQIKDMSVRSCAGHVATLVARDFKIEPQRMLWVEYYPVTIYGKNGSKTIPEKFVAVDFTWHEAGALDPKWRDIKPPLLDMLKGLIDACED